MQKPQQSSGAPVNNFVRESHSTSWHPTIWGWLVELANDQYGGNISAALQSLVLYNRGVQRAKELQGQKHSHHMTAGVTTDPELLDAAIREIESSDPGFSALTWLEIQRHGLPPKRVDGDSTGA